MSIYQNDIQAISNLKQQQGSAWDAISPESAARMRAQNRFQTGLDIARYTAGIMRRDMAAYDADPSKYTQSLGCWHGFIGQQNHGVRKSEPLVQELGFDPCFHELGQVLGIALGHVRLRFVEPGEDFDPDGPHLRAVSVTVAAGNAVAGTLVAGQRVDLTGRQVLRQGGLAEVHRLGECPDRYFPARDEMTEDQQPLLVGHELQKLRCLSGPGLQVRKCRQLRDRDRRGEDER